MYTYRTLSEVQTMNNNLQWWYNFSLHAFYERRHFGCNCSLSHTFAMVGIIWSITPKYQNNCISKFMFCMRKLISQAIIYRNSHCCYKGSQYFLIDHLRRKQLTLFHSLGIIFHFRDKYFMKGIILWLIAHLYIQLLGVDMMVRIIWSITPKYQNNHLWYIYCMIKLIFRLSLIHTTATNVVDISQNTQRPFSINTHLELGLLTLIHICCVQTWGGLTGQ